MTDTEQHLLQCTHCEGSGRVPEASWMGSTICPDCMGSGYDEDPPDWYIEELTEKAGLETGNHA